MQVVVQLPAVESSSRLCGRCMRAVKAKVWSFMGIYTKLRSTGGRSVAALNAPQRVLYFICNFELKR